VVRAKEELKHLLKSFSNVGENILQVLRKSEESFKGFFTPGMLFEALKFEYVGPIPGHQIDNLIETLKNVRDFSHGPILIHVITKKGKGYQPAEENPGDYHGVGPFNLENGAPVPVAETPISYTRCFGDTLVHLAEKEPKIVAITAAMPAGTGLTRFARRFPSRFFDVGIAEQHAVTFAAGLATEGLLPVVAIYSTFLQRALDQVIHDVCLQNLPVTFALDRGGVVGDDGPTHHGVFDLNYLRFIPNLVLMAPKDENELQHLLYTAIQHKGPAALRYPRGAGEGVELSDNLSEIPIGKGELLRQGKDILLLPVGNRVYPALEAALRLEKVGIDAAVINPRFIKPLDNELIIEWAEKTGRVITVEDNARMGGFGSAVLELLTGSTHSHIKVTTLGYGDRYMEHATQEILWSKGKIDVPAITNAAMELMDAS
jgi:1-deoxy-D-xylulose-5-phosphate synthase